MKILVFNVPAEKDGALTILNQYYNQAINDTENEWIFVVSTPVLKSTDNVKILNYPWVKKSWFHRLYFEITKANKLVESYKPDQILSLQNTTILKTDVPQVLYLHQPLPFVEKKFGIFENPKFWVYQNLISKLIYNSIKKSDKTIVQTKWMLHAAMEKTNSKKDKFILKKPEPNIHVKFKYFNDGQNTFFYPASALTYKNHDTIIRASKILDDKKIYNYNIVFTLNGNETTEVVRMKEFINKHSLPIEFIGKIPIEEVYEYYAKSTLIFASYIETFGLPLLEGRIHECPVIASDTPFSREILDGYTKATFFDPFNAKELAKSMRRQIGLNS